MGLFDIFKSKKKTKNKKPEKKIDIGESNDFEKDVKDYWGLIVAGDIKLENGEIFSDFNYYNKKHLKYDTDTIGGVLTALAITSEDDQFKQICQTMYMYLASFDEDIEDKIETRIGKYMTMKKKHNKQKPKNREQKIEQYKEFATIKDEEPYTYENLQKQQARRAKIFGMQISI